MDENIIWIPENEVKQAFSLAKQAVEPHLKREFRKGRIGKESAIEQHHALLLGEEIVLKLSEYGISAVELMEWMETQAEKKKAQVEKEKAAEARQEKAEMESAAA